MADRLFKVGVQVIMIYIQEAHTTLWPIGLNHPFPQLHFEDRCARAQTFVDEEKCPYPVWVDGWDNTFTHTFQAWPDRYFLVTQQGILLMQSEYGTGDQDAKVILDCTRVLEAILQLYEM